MRSTSNRVIKSVALAISLGLSICGSAYATKLSAPPLPHERESKDFEQGQTSVIQQTSRFQRRPDYREVEAQKKQDEINAAKKVEETKLHAIEEAKKAQAEQIENIKKRQQMAAEANNRAVAHGKQGHWTEALANHEESVKLDPQNKQFRINLSAARTAFAQSRLAAGDHASAQSMFRKALAAAPDNGLAGRLLAESMQRQGLNPLSADVRLKIGDQLAAIGDLESASVEYQAALQIEGSARCYVKMGDTALRYGQVSTAINWYRQAIVKDPDQGAAHRQLGLLSLAQRDYTGAAASLRKAVILDPKDVAAGQALVEIWRRQVATNPLLAENHLGLAGALQLTGDFVGADSEYRKLEALEPKNPGLEAGRQSLARAVQHAKADKHKLAAETLFNQGLRREALAEISQAVMMEPRNSKFQFLLGECLEANGDYQGAHRAYLTCVLIDPENNKEAAARMKEMQSGMKRGGVSGQQVNQMTSQVVNQIANQYNRPNQAMMQQQQQQMMQQQQQQMMMQQQQQQAMQQAVQQAPVEMPRKDMFEGGPGMQAAMNNGLGMGMATHDEREVPVSRPVATQQAVQQAAPVSPQAAALNAAFARITDAESQRDYTSAVNMLKQLLAGNLQNAEVHHRLAVNLLAGGNITEAISEFRIASALAPTKKAYADDLARAMVIHKRSLMSNAGNSSSGDGTSPGANQ